MLIKLRLAGKFPKENRMADKKEKKKNVVTESVQVRRAREKLKRRMETIEQKITVQALEKKSLEIHQWIAKHASDRVVLYAKEISLFDENQNTAKVSQKVSLLAERIQKETRTALNPLEKNDANLS
jgi:ubiquinone biosynthesis protein UbiJ